eukprot:TRINITY_DN5763_c0_g3_i1.p2 TRINITY_DN5763_c0_g3~~TRINITY_DN5763_c0_g3_i1.p2  ORF type:complete len:271 (+),score=98.32 TRINITY_DN5763_c0_g3_i1:46-813(+)
MATRPDWCLVPEPVVDARCQWRHGDNFFPEDNVDRTDVGWGDLKVLSPKSIAANVKDRIRKEPIISRNEGAKDAFMLHNVLSEHECLEIINACNEKQFSPALVAMGGYQQYLPDYRSGLRCIVDSPKFSQLLFNRMAPFLPKVAGNGGQLFDFNERMRVLCYYRPNDLFEQHYDSVFKHPVTKAVSAYTLQLYLNTIPDAKVDGGGTAFTDAGEVVTPRAGSVLCFTQNLSHEGQALLTGGIKYTIRTEAMYRKD